MAKRSRKGYYVKGEFIAAGSDADRQIREELDDANANSRTAQKRASRNLQVMGEELIAAHKGLLDSLPLPEPLADAIHDARTFPSFGAKRRQTQYIGKLMRRLDDDTIEAIRAALQAEHGNVAKAARQLHEAEQWRDSLITDDESLAQWVEKFPGANIQELRSLIRQARRDAAAAESGASGRHGRAYRQIFSLVRAALDARDEEGGTREPR
jgi:ribosome-associated protein